MLKINRVAVEYVEDQCGSWYCWRLMWQLKMLKINVTVEHVEDQYGSWKCWRSMRQLTIKFKVDNIEDQSDIVWHDTAADKSTQYMLNKSFQVSPTTIYSIHCLHEYLYCDTNTELPTFLWYTFPRYESTPESVCRKIAELQSATDKFAFQTGLRRLFDQDCRLLTEAKSSGEIRLNTQDTESFLPDGTCKAHARLHKWSLLVEKVALDTRLLRYHCLWYLAFFFF